MIRLTSKTVDGRFGRCSRFARSGQATYLSWFIHAKWSDVERKEIASLRIKGCPSGRESPAVKTSGKKLETIWPTPFATLSPQFRSLDPFFSFFFLNSAPCERISHGEYFFNREFFFRQRRKRRVKRGFLGFCVETVRLQNILAEIWNVYVWLQVVVKDRYYFSYVINKWL